jgi:hypothetical protein
MTAIGVHAEPSFTKTILTFRCFTLGSYRWSKLRQCNQLYPWRLIGLPNSSYRRHAEPVRQAKLFENTAPIAANADPITSHLAAEELTDSGARDAQKYAVLSALRLEIVPPTSRELSQAAKLDRYVVARRLPDLEADGWARKVGQRKCSITDRQCVTWEAVRK